MKSDTPEILSLTGLRFVAAFYVFVFHINMRWPVVPDSRFFTNVLSQGAVGMSLFFMLSGFVLAYRYGDGSGDFKAYLINRLSRIYPVYLLAALLTVPWMGISLSSDAPDVLLKQAIAIVTLIVTDIFLLQAWFPQVFFNWNNSGSWSISVEAFCYLLLPLILSKLAGTNVRTAL